MLNANERDLAILLLSLAFILGLCGLFQWFVRAQFEASLLGLSLLFGALGRALLYLIERQPDEDESA